MRETHFDYQKHVRSYLVVFAALAALTVITVAISYLPIPTAPAMLLALAIASVKGALVMAVFMHLMDERQAITAILLFTAVLLGILLVFPVLTSGS